MKVTLETVLEGLEWDGHGRWRLTGPITQRNPARPNSVSFVVTVLSCGFIHRMSEVQARRTGPFLVRLTALDPIDPTNGVAFENRTTSFDEAVSWACERARGIGSWNDALREGGVEDDCWWWRRTGCVEG